MLNVTSTETTKTAKTGSKPKNRGTVTVNTQSPNSVTAQLAGTFAIRKGIPMPASRNNRGGVSKYPWEAMQTGDMFFVPGAKIETFYTATAAARKKYSKTFKAAQLTEDGVEGVGVWCL